MRSLVLCLMLLVALAPSAESAPGRKGLFRRVFGGDGNTVVQQFDSLLRTVIDGIDTVKNVVIDVINVSKSQRGHKPDAIPKHQAPVAMLPVDRRIRLAAASSSAPSTRSTSAPQTAGLLLLTLLVPALRAGVQW